MINTETKGRYLDPESVDEYRKEVQEKRQKQIQEERRAAGQRMSCWAGLVLMGGGLIAMILNGLIDQTIGVCALAVICALLGRGTK